jgi:phosphoribosylformimino-5-aminoimidazole carboxamide ribotide isomerase
MELLPAIDLREGKVVRLRRGDDQRRTIYDLDPLDALRRYADAGVAMVHCVDLDAAFGQAPQRALVERMLALPQAPRIELGGGLRDREAVRWALDAGCARVVLTSLLVRDPELFDELAAATPGRLVPALDVEGESVRYHGWTASSPHPLEVLCARLRALPIAAVLVTDIALDGMLEGPNIELARRVGAACGVPAIVSGGVRSLADLEAASRYREIGGVIVGKALYDGAIALDAAVALVRSLTASREVAR